MATGIPSSALVHIAKLYGMSSAEFIEYLFDFWCKQNEKRTDDIGQAIHTYLQEKG